MSAFGFPDPPVNDDMRPFYEATAERRFTMMKCKRCGFWQWPYGGCRNHDNEPYLANMEWAQASGRGKVHSFTIARLPFNESFPVPYVYAIVETDEGPLIPSNILGCKPEDVRIGMPVTVTFEELPSGRVLSKFKSAWRAMP